MSTVTTQYETPAAEPPAVIPRGDKDAILNSIVDSYRTHTNKEHHRKKYRSGKPRKNVRKIRKFIQTTITFSST